MSSSPRSFIIIALASWLLLGALHLAGCREHMAFLSGTPVSAAGAIGGVAYGAAWFTAVLVAPALAIGAPVLALLLRLARPRDG